MCITYNQSQFGQRRNDALDMTCSAKVLWKYSVQRVTTKHLGNFLQTELDQVGYGRVQVTIAVCDCVQI